MIRQQFKKKGILLIEDDLAYGALMTAAAKAENVPLTVFASLADMGSFARMGEFDVAIFDYALDNVNGVEMSEYVTAFFSEVPVILISAYRLDQVKEKRWPASVRRFISKDMGVRSILSAAVAELRKPIRSEARRPQPES